MAKTVLIVEDDDDIRESLIELLEEEGYVVEGVRDGAEALRNLKAAKTLPGLIILDIMMPGMNGFEFRQAQEADPSLAHIPVVVMTADAHAEAKKLKLGAQALLKKPLQIEELIRIVERFT